MNYQYQDGKNFYLTINGKVIELRRKIIINNTIKYVIDSKITGITYVTKNDFYTVPENYKLIKI